MNHRWLNKIYAKLNGYFWIPCPVCGQYFGGHEWDDENTIYEGNRGTGICRDCRDYGGETRMFETEINRLNKVIQELCPHKQVYKGERIYTLGYPFPLNYYCLLCRKSFEDVPKGSKLVKFECEWREVKE